MWLEYMEEIIENSPEDTIGIMCKIEEIKRMARVLRELAQVLKDKWIEPDEVEIEWLGLSDDAKELLG